VLLSACAKSIDLAVPHTNDAGAEASDANFPTKCLGSQLLADLGGTKVLVGGAMEDTIASKAPFDLRALEIDGGLSDGLAPCTSCATDCSADGTSCGTAECTWWGCWQSAIDAPGDYVRSFVQASRSAGQIPMISYRVLPHATGNAEGSAQVLAVNDEMLMARYFADFRFLLRQVGEGRALIHLEPGFWTLAERVDENPHALPASVVNANPTDCTGFENTVSGLGKCMIAMVRTYAPKAKVGLHAASFGTYGSALENGDPTFDVAADAKKVAAFLLECGAYDGDFLAIDVSEGDAGWLQTQSRNGWWDAENLKLPSFKQAFTWGRTLSETIERPLVWWHAPFGNMSLPNKTNQWKDNRLDYFFDHVDEVASTHAIAIAFGASNESQTTPSTDGGNFVARVRTYKSAAHHYCQ